jgi:cathepsin X
MSFRLFLSLVVLFVYVCTCEARARGIVRFPEPIETVEYTYRPILTEFPPNFDWRNINGTNYCSRTLTQKAISICGSCWAEALTGALTDRYLFATKGLLQVQLSPQNLLNFKKHITGGSCEGGDALKGYEFVHRYGITDDSCMPFRGLEYIYGFEVHDMTSVEDVQAHMCYTCLWNGNCGFVPRKAYNVYGADEFGNVLGVNEMMSEIYARGPIACMVNSDAPAFEVYKGGIILNEDIPAQYNKDTDHVVVIAGWGVDSKTNVPYWVGRNSYGSQWGEGAGGGWFRLQRGSNALGLEAAKCHWATPAKADVERALAQWQESVAY